MPGTSMPAFGPASTFPPGLPTPTGLPPDLQQWFSIEVLTVLYGCISVIGLVGNSLVLWFYFANKHRSKRPTSVFLVNLAISDICTCLLLTPTDLSRHSYSTVPKNALGTFFCSFVFSHYLPRSAGMASAYTLSCITAERYVAVMQPLRYKRLFTAKRCVILSVAAWLVALGFGAASFASFEPRHGRCVPTFHIAGRLSSGFEGMVDCALILGMLVTYIRIYVELRRRIKITQLMITPNSSGQCVQQDKREASVRAVTAISVLVVSGYIITRTGNAIFSLTVWIDPMALIKFVDPQFLIFLGWSNSAINPILYTIVNPTFRKTLLCRRQANESSTPHQVQADNIGRQIDVSAVPGNIPVQQAGEANRRQTPDNDIVVASVSIETHKPRYLAVGHM